MADDINKRREALQAELNLQQMLTDAVKTHKSMSNDGLKIKQDLVAAMAEEADLASKIEDIDKSITDLLMEQVKRGDTVNQHYIEQLSGAKEILKLKQQQKETEDEILGYQKEAKDELLGSLGTLGEMLKAGTTLGFAMAALKGVTEGIGTAFKDTIGLASELNQELGMGATEAMEAGMMNFSAEAMFSKYSVAELNTATRDFAETMGTTAGLTNDLRNSMAAMTKMGVGGAEAAKMAQSMELAGGSANDMTEGIQEMANAAGVQASGVMKDLASQQSLMVGMTAKEINLLAKKSIELRKQGTSLEMMEGISESMMDIGSTLKAQAKARAMLGNKLTQTQLQGMQDMTAAGLEFQRTGDMSKLQEALKKTNMDAKQFKELGPAGQKAYAEGIGLSKDALAEMIQKQEQAKKIEAGGMDGAIAKSLELWQRTPDVIKEGTTALIGYIAQMAVMKLMNGEGIGSLNPFGKKKGGGGGSIETEMPGKKEVGQTQSGGGLKSLAEGLREMGDGKVFAGIGAVALAGPAFIIALPSIPFLLFMGKVKLKALEENFSGLATGLNSMSTTFMGSLAMGAFGIAAIPSILSIPFLLFMGKVGLKNLASNFIQLGAGLQMMSSTFMGSLALAAFGVAALIAIPSLIFLGGIALLGAVGAAGLTALGGGLAALGGVAATGLPFLAIALIGALGIAMIPFAYALSLVTPLVEAFGNIIIGVFAAVPPIVQAVADGFVTMMGALTPESIGGLLLLGPALVMASIGMIAFSAAMLVGGLSSFFGGGIIDDITELAMIGPQLEMAGNGLASITTNLSGVTGVVETLADSLSKMGSVTAPLYGVAGGLFSISAGLSTLSFAGLMALPAIGGLMALAAVAPALESLGEFFGMGGSSESSESSTSSTSSGTKELIDELKGLRSDIQSQPILINVDGKTVSRISRVQRQQSSQKP